MRRLVLGGHLPLIASALGLLLACFAALAGEKKKLTGPEWPQWKGGSGFTGVSPDDSVKPPFKLLWSYRLDGETGDGGGGVTVGGGRVYVCDVYSHFITALDAHTGEFLWETGTKSRFAMF